MWVVFYCLQKIHRFWGKNVASAARIKAKDDWRFLSLWQLHIDSTISCPGVEETGVMPFFFPAPRAPILVSQADAVICSPQNPWGNPCLSLSTILKNWPGNKSIRKSVSAIWAEVHLRQCISSIFYGHWTAQQHVPFPNWRYRSSPVPNKKKEVTQIYKD